MRNYNNKSEIQDILTLNKKNDIIVLNHGNITFLIYICVCMYITGELELPREA